MPRGKKNREIITNICALIKIISYKEKKTTNNIKSQIKIMLCGLLCCHAMACYGEQESNDVLRDTLLCYCKIFQCYDTTYWFICYTMLYVVKNMFELIKMERMFLAIKTKYMKYEL